MRVVSEQALKDMILNLKETLAWEEKGYQAQVRQISKAAEDTSKNIGLKVIPLAFDMSEKYARIVNLKTQIELLEHILANYMVDVDQVGKEVS